VKASPRGYGAAPAEPRESNTSGLPEGLPVAAANPQLLARRLPKKRLVQYTQT